MKKVQYFVVTCLLVGGLLLLPSFAQANLIQNGSFEQGIDPKAYTGVGVGNPAIEEWDVVSGNIDYIRTHWLAADGERSVDLNGNQAGAISQSFPTTLGVQYEVLFALAGNPDRGPTIKTLEVSAGADLQEYTFSISGKSRSAMGWEEKVFVFTAIDSTTTLTFSSLTSGAWGPAIDNVVVQVRDTNGSNASLGGSVTGMTPSKVVCQNRTTKKKVLIQNGARSWDCEAAGLAVGEGDTVIIQIRGTVDTEVAAEPAIEFTYVPAYGSFENVEGRVINVSPANYKVAVFIRVRGGWWTKPYWSTPLTNIRLDGSWECDYTTGGIDQQATDIVAYLVPDGYDPPLMSGGSTLPAELDLNAVAKVETTRTP